MQFAASIASSNLLCIGNELKRLGECSLFHYDIEDGNFTPNITFGLSLLRKVRPVIESKQLSVHLMTTDPVSMLLDLASCNVNGVFAHIESLAYPMVFINQAKALGMDVGLAVNIKTPISSLAPFVPALDAILVMTSEPDGADEKMWEPALRKAVEAANTYPIPVWADGGLTQEAVRELYSAGVRGCVLGRMIFGADDPVRLLSELQQRYGANKDGINSIGFGQLTRRR